MQKPKNLCFILIESGDGLKADYSYQELSAIYRHPTLTIHLQHQIDQAEQGIVSILRHPLHPTNRSMAGTS